MSVAAPRAPDLRPLEERVAQALARGDSEGLEVLGWGEVSVVLRWPGPDGPLACKRLPLFADAAALEAYGAVLERYLAQLAAAGVQVLETRLHAVPLADGRVAAYCVQPELPRAALLTAVLGRADDATAHGWLQAVLARIAQAVSPVLGLDGQLSNWALRDGRLLYLDVTTPLLRDARGAELLDVGLFLASLPTAVRALARRFLLQGILDKYYLPRGVALDLLGNLYKEGLERLLPAGLALANRWFTPALTAREVERYYSQDARSWELLLRARRADRWWQRRVRGRNYQFLLPGRIDRRR